MEKIALFHTYVELVKIMVYDILLLFASFFDNWLMSKR